SVPENAQAGEHSFTLTLQAANKAPLKLPLTVRVLPFRLIKPPDKRWLLYSDSWLLGNLPDDKLLSVLKEIAEVGVDGLTELPFGKLDLTELKEGKVAYDPEPLLRWLNLMRKVGLRGPHTIGTFIEDQAARALGLTVDLNKEWDEQLVEAMRLIARTVVKALRPHRFDWLFYGWDEPGPENLRAIQQYRYWREGGAKTYVTFYQRGTYEVAGQWMTHPCFSVGLVNRKETAEWARKECDKNGQKFFWYGSGCYLGQEGRMFPNRYLTGWLFWKTRADGQVSWTFIRPHEDPFNDFDGAKANQVEPKDQCTVYPHLERANNYRSILGIIPTIQWEAIREGISDYCYAYTLKNLVTYAKGVASRQNTKFARQLLELANEAEAVLRLVEESVPWGNEVGARKYTNKDLQQVRLILARQIERLVLALEGKRVAQKGAKERQVLVRVQIMPPESAGLTASAPLPVTAIPKLEAAPKIDGKVDGDEWRDAALVEPFRNHQTGQPMPAEISTRALVGFDEKALYIAFLCLEPNPQGMRKSQWARDSDGVWQDESVEVFIASEENPNRYVHIVVNPVGSIYDELVFDVGWNADVQVATSIGPNLWTCELAIPWSSLPFVKSQFLSGKSLRINFCRNRNQVDKGVTHWAWSPTFGWFHTPERFGIGTIESGEIIVTQIQLPRYFGESRAVVKLRNRSDELKKVKVDGQEVVLQPKSENQVQLTVPASVGEHRKRIELSWGNELRSFEVAYAIPEPLRLVSPIILANEQGEAILPLVINLSPELMRKSVLIVEASGKQIPLPLTSTPLQFRCPLKSSSASVRLRLDKTPEWSVTAKLFSPK
ncbi:MAG: carbohydrate-binding family 9-like protein, partial [Armatimonadota bacterium]